MLWATVYPPRRFPEEKESCKGGTIGDLVKYLQQFPQDWSISVLSKDGKLRDEIYLEDQVVGTVLLSQGEEIGL